MSFRVIPWPIVTVGSLLKAWIAASYMLLLVGSVDAAELHGRVVSVPDGDSIVIADRRNRESRVRLAGIDAPEKGQAFSSRSREHLVGLVLGETVTVRWNKRDGYDRLVGTVYLGGRDINLEQVRAGFAWWYRHYADEQSAPARHRYASAEREAQVERRGLWADHRPVPPWAWRHAR